MFHPEQSNLSRASSHIKKWDSPEARCRRKEAMPSRAGHPQVCPVPAMPRPRESQSGPSSGEGHRTADQAPRTGLAVLEGSTLPPPHGLMRSVGRSVGAGEPPRALGSSHCLPPEVCSMGVPHALRNPVNLPDTVGEQAVFWSVASVEPHILTSVLSVPVQAGKETWPCPPASRSEHTAFPHWALREFPSGHLF